MLISYQTHPHTHITLGTEHKTRQVDIEKKVLHRKVKLFCTHSSLSRYKDIKLLIHIINYIE